MTDQQPGPDEPYAPLPAVPHAPQPPQAQVPQAPQAPQAPIPLQYGGYAPYPYSPQPYAGQHYGYTPVYPPPPRPSRRSSLALKSGAVATAFVVVAGVSFAVGTTRAKTHTVQVPAASSGSSAGNGFGQFGFGGSASPGFTDPSQGQGTGTGTGTASLPSATSTESIGVVDVNTNLKYQGVEGAGTGMILDSGGDVLTNNHVVNGATSIKVTVVSTGKTYTAKVVGTDPTQDIAVIKLSNASGLSTANFGDSSSVKVGDAVTGVGNAGGAGGTPSAAAGKVLALNQSITAGDDNGANAEKLPNVIVSDAPIQAGDSGGPLYNSKDQIIGIDTAANTSGSSQGFSIPINTAKALADEIMAGNQTTSIHIGYPGFLGVSISTTQSGGRGALVGGVLSGGPAASAGLVTGDQITKVGSTKTPTATALSKAMVGLKPGQRVSVTYVDASGASHTRTLTLATGPAD
jgi:S1-C subfamily serine protease